MKRFVELTVRKGSTLASLERHNPEDLHVVLEAFLTYLPDGESTELPNRESEILERLCANRSRVVSAKEILLDLWGDDDFFSTRSFQVLISRLRHRLSKDPGISIMNIRGEGYRLIC